MRQRQKVRGRLRLLDLFSSNREQKKEKLTSSEQRGRARELRGP